MLIGTSLALTQFRPAGVAGGGAADVDNLLLEDGSNLLQEDGSFWLLEGVLQIDVSPAGIVVGPGETYQYAASIAGGSITPDTWAASGGSIDANGLWTAPAGDGVYTITAGKAGMLSGTVDVEVFDILALMPESFSVVDGCGVANGAPITSFVDLSGNNRPYEQGVAGGRPLRRAAILNGHDAAEFDGVDDNVNNANFVTQSLYGARTVYVVVRMLVAGTNDVPFMFAGGYVRLYSDSGVWLFDGDAGLGSLVSAGGNVLNWTLAAFRVNSIGSLQCRINDDAWLAVTPNAIVFAGDGNNQDIRLGKHIDFDAANCQSPGVLFIPSAVSDAVDSRIRRLLNTKYGFAFFSPS